MDIALEQKHAREQHENMCSFSSSSSSFTCSYSSTSSSSTSSSSSSPMIPMKNTSSHVIHSLKRCHSMIDLTNDENEDNNVGCAVKKPNVEIYYKNM